MRKRSASIISAILSAVILFGVTACNGDTEVNPTTTTKAAEATTTKAEEGTTEGGDEFAGYPMDTDVTLSWYINHGPTLNTAFGTWEESPFHSGLNDMVGVDIDWMFPTVGTDGTQDFNLMMASETLPDMMFGEVNKEADRHIDEGTVMDLTPYLEEHAPAYWAWLQELDVRDKAMKTDTGKYFGFGFFREDGGWNDTYLGPVVRQDWLDEQDLESPKTISEFENVIKVFYEEYDVPFSFAWGARLNNIALAGAFGAHGGTVFQMFVDTEEDTVKLAQAQPEWKDYISKLQEWYDNGWIDQDVFTNDDTIMRTKAQNEEMGISFTSMGQLSNWESDAAAAGTGANWVGLQYPTDDEGNLSSVFGGFGIDPNNVSFVTQDIDEDKIPIALRVMDYAYTEDGLLYWNFGKEDVSWEYNDDGEVVYLPLVTEDPDGLNDAISKYGGSTWNGPNIQATRMLHLKNTDIAIAANDTWFYENEEQTHADKLPSGVSFTVEESNEIADIQTAIQTHISESAAAFVTGERSMDEFDDFLSELEGMNYTRLEELYTQAYERYLSR